MYLGDSDDDADCFKMVGYPVVAFLAPEDAKKRYAEEYNAFVPRDKPDLEEYLANHDAPH